MVLNTCCIRENADNKLYGHLGHLKSLQRPQARPPDRRRRLPRPEGPGRHPPSAPATSTSSSAPTTCPGRPACCARPAPAGARSIEMLDAPTGDDEAFPSAMLVRPRAALRGVGDDPGRLRQHLRLLHRARRCAGPEHEPALRRPRCRGRGAGGRRHRRGDSPRPERQLLRPGPDDAPSPGRRRPGGRGALAHLAGGRWAAEAASRARPLFADLLRAVGGVAGSGASASPARTRRTCGPRPSPRWPRPRPCASSSTCRCSREATACSPPCAAATPPSATSSGWRRRGPRSRTWR